MTANMPTATHHDPDRDELVRMAGEQALLKRDNDTLIAAQQRDQLALRNLVNNLTTSPDWHARGTELLNRSFCCQLCVSLAALSK